MLLRTSRGLAPAVTIFILQLNERRIIIWLCVNVPSVFLQDHQNGCLHHRADLVRQVNGTPAERISSAFMVTRCSFKRDLSCKWRQSILPLRLWSRLSVSPPCQSATGAFISLSPAVELFLLSIVHEWAPRTWRVCADGTHRDARAAGTRRLALPATWNTCQPASSLCCFSSQSFLFLPSDIPRVSPVMDKCPGEENTCVRFVTHFDDLLHKSVELWNI